MPSIQSFVVKTIFRLIKQVSSLHDRTIEEKRAAMETLAKNGSLPKHTTIDTVEYEGVPCDIYSPNNAPDGKLLLYIHGGAYNVGTLASYRLFVSNFSQECNIKTIMPGYRLAPEYPFPAALEDVMTVYGNLLKQGYQAKNLILGGDSAGGGLCISTLMAARERGLPMPRGCFVLSPWTDLGMTGESYQTFEHKDAMLKRKELTKDAAMYVGNNNLKNPLISPVFGDLSGLPPLLIQVGSEEMLLDDSKRLADVAHEAGVNVSIEVWNGMFHVWQLMWFFMPEAKQAIQEIVKFIWQRFAD
ncbi:MAG: alpha/beta hydrolase [Anaerolineaceae bacterium]|nr:alpha/beta hydrolase [Anaerolineaceae bacterium]